MPNFILFRSDLCAAGNDSEADYTSVVEQSISFTSANRIQDLMVQIVPDNFTEFNETFRAVLTSVFLARTAGGVALELTDQESAHLILNPDTATVNILDDDGIGLCICYRLIKPKYFIIIKITVTIIGFQNTVLNASEDSRGLQFDIAVLNGILRVNMSIDFTTNDNSARGT